MTGEITVQDGIYIEVTGTSTKGTIGKLVDLDVGEPNATTGRIYIRSVIYIIQIDGRDNPSRINSSYSEILDDYNGKTKWVRSAVKKDIPKIPHKDKYGQEIELGSWLVGIGSGKTLHWGKVIG